jgi:hypothetical protein
MGTLGYVRKLLLTMLAGVMLSMVFAAPAFALRDPFNPSIDLTPSTGGGGGTVVTPPTTGGNPQPASVGSEGLANTGLNTEPWLVAAYGLIAVGGAAVYASKTLRATA